LTDEEYKILPMDYGIFEMSDKEEEAEVQVKLRKDKDVDKLANELEKKVNI
jgi:hypothetical protein